MDLRSPHFREGAVGGHGAGGNSLSGAIGFGDGEDFCKFLYTTSIYLRTVVLVARQPLVSNADMSLTACALELLSGADGCMINCSVLSLVACILFDDVSP
eukprot:451-Heterococcus_DN1.PRE.2